MTMLDHLCKELLALSDEDRDELLRALARKGMGLHPMTSANAFTLAKHNRKHDKSEPSKLLRALACSAPDYAFEYAQNIDNGISDYTRSAASESPQWAFQYTAQLEKWKPHDVTRAGACKSPFWAWAYAEDIDKGYHPETWAAVQGSEHEAEYRKKFSIPAEEGAA